MQHKKDSSSLFHKSIKPKVKKVLISKTALFKFPKLDEEGNEIPTAALRIKEGNKIIKDFTDGSFDKLLKEDPKRTVYRSKSPENLANLNITEERIVTPETNEMVVYKGIIFYKSSATSGSEVTKRLDTWIPSLGLDDQSSHGLGSTGPVFKITKLDSLYDKRFSKPEARIKKYESYLGEDLMKRLHNFDVMLMSAEIGGGFWDTKDEKDLIKQLKHDGFLIQTKKIKINDQNEHKFEIPFEVKKEDDALIANKTKTINNFLKQEGGLLHSGLRLNDSKNEKLENGKDIYEEIYNRARKATYTLKYPESYAKLTANKPVNEALISLFKDYYKKNILHGHWRHHQDKAKDIVEFLEDSQKSQSLDTIQSYLNPISKDLKKDSESSGDDKSKSSFLRRINFALDLLDSNIPISLTNKNMLKK